MDYIVPATCTDTEFRQMWAEFEWENKVTVNTNITALADYLAHVMKCTNMKCLTPEKVGHGEGDREAVVHVTLLWCHIHSPAQNCCGHLDLLQGPIPCTFFVVCISYKFVGRLYPIWICVCFLLLFFKPNTRMPPSILKQDPNTWKVQNNAIYLDKTQHSWPPKDKWISSPSHFSWVFHHLIVV